MKNRSYNLTSEILYALERQARVARSKEMARMFAALASKIAGLLHHVPHESAKAAGHV